MRNPFKYFYCVITLCGEQWISYRQHEHTPYTTVNIVQTQKPFTCVCFFYVFFFFFFATFVYSFISSQTLPYIFNYVRIVSYYVSTNCIQATKLTLKHCVRVCVGGCLFSALYGFTAGVYYQYGIFNILYSTKRLMMAISSCTSMLLMSSANTRRPVVQTSH